MPLSILVCGIKPVIVPSIGPATPARSDKSPVRKLKSFSSIIVLSFIVEPSVKVRSLIRFSKPS